MEQAFYSALNDEGRAGFVMANSAGDAGGTELEIRKKLLAENAVDVIVAVGPNFSTRSCFHRWVEALDSGGHHQRN